MHAGQLQSEHAGGGGQSRAAVPGGGVGGISLQRGPVQPSAQKHVGTPSSSRQSAPFSHGEMESQVRGSGSASVQRTPVQSPSQMQAGAPSSSAQRPCTQSEIVSQEAAGGEGASTGQGAGGSATWQTPKNVSQVLTHLVSPNSPV